MTRSIGQTAGAAPLRRALAAPLPGHRQVTIARTRTPAPESTRR